MPERKTLLRHLYRLQQMRIRHRDNDWLVRTDVAKPIADLFCYAYVALLPRAREMVLPFAPTDETGGNAGAPRRGATPSTNFAESSVIQSMTEIRCSSRV